MDVPGKAQADACSQKPSLFEWLRARWHRLRTWLDRIDPARLIGGSDVFK